MKNKKAKELIFHIMEIGDFVAKASKEAPSQKEWDDFKKILRIYFIIMNVSVIDLIGKRDELDEEIQEFVSRVKENI